ncbi:hypothetical protein ACRAWD_16900 [Caulobacter segnis]
MSAQTHPYNVLFLCTHNSARSIIAECIMNRVGAGRFVASSAGSMPSGEVNPHAISLLQRLNYKTDHLRSKGWDAFSLESNPNAPETRFRVHRLRQRRGRGLPDLARPADERPLGRSQSRRSGRLRSRDRPGLRRGLSSAQ